MAVNGVVMFGLVVTLGPLASCAEHTGSDPDEGGLAGAQPSGGTGGTTGTGGTGGIGGIAGSGGSGVIVDCFGGPPYWDCLFTASCTPDGELVSFYEDSGTSICGDWMVCETELEPCPAGSVCTTAGRERHDFEAVCTPIEQACGGPDGRACPEGQFCEYGGYVEAWWHAPERCGAESRGMYGICQEQPDAASCPELGTPACGCDGTTYDSDCLRQVAGVSLQNLGLCPP